MAFSVGQLVCLKADPSRQGPVIEAFPPAAGRVRYRVFHSPGEIREYYEDQIAGIEGARPPGSRPSLLSRESFLPVDEFRARLTAARLANPLTDNLYALHAARIKFIPFQFKPLLRVLRADQPRLLIADEVGVGKTIEAGLVLKELESRQRLENVLVVCPKALVTKWRAEMRRFDEDFQPLTAEALRYCLRETELDGVWPAKYSRTIVHLELFRNPDYLFGVQGRHPRPGLVTLYPPARFSLAIFDEAHHLRNQTTNSNRLAQVICDNSEAVLFLSATPVQLGSRNLFSLLNLLRPDLFPDEVVFNEMVAPNRQINQAIRHTRSRKPDATWQAEASRLLVEAAATPWGARTLVNDPRFNDCIEKLGAPTPLSDTDRICCLRDLEEVHTLAHVMNRTRRRDIGRFTTREPRTISVPFTVAQGAFYRELIAFRREVLLLKYDPLVIRLITDMLERQAASSLPALLPALDTFLRTGRFSTSGLSDAQEEEEAEFDLPEALRRKAQGLRHLASQLPPDDPKMEALLAIAQTARDGAGSGKLLVFSYFLHTLHYLAAKLRSAGFRVGVVTGQVEDEERERLRDRFRVPSSSPNALDILLSSEVGCEGLDYEFCDRMVNYDIPWNPMRLEQRIGRIDRFGQQSEKVLIFNFVTPGTVEERIFFRCFERLGVFRDTVGDCEEVLGEQAVAEQLLGLARDSRLTPEQSEVRAMQLADNAVRLVEERRRLEEESGSLLGYEQALTDEVNAIDAEGRFVSADELRAMISFFVEQANLGGSLGPDRGNPLLSRLRLNKEARATLANRVRRWQSVDRSVIEFRRWLDGSEPQLLVTFDQQTALERRDLPFITPVHPLARLATQALRRREKPLAARVSAQSTDVPAGSYVFVCDLWETVSIKPEVRLMSLAWATGERRMAPEVSTRLLRLLSQGQSVHVPLGLRDHVIQEGLSALDEQTYREREAAVSELLVRNEQLVARKLASLDAYHQNRIARIQTELSAATEERIIRMRTSEHTHAEADYAARRQDIESRRRADIIRERIAVGILEVKHAN